MVEWKKICCPVDFSEGSEAALELAADLARRFGAQLTVLHVYQPPHTAIPVEGAVYVPQDFFESMAEKVTQELADWKRRAEKRSEGSVTATMLSGLPFAEIKRYAKEGRFDLIVMGTEGRTGLRHLFLGSVAERVVRLADCPVLTVRPNKSGKAE